MTAAAFTLATKSDGPRIRDAVNATRGDGPKETCKQTGLLVTANREWRVRFELLAERCIGLATRKGQAEGRIAKMGEGGGPRKSRVGSTNRLPVTAATGMSRDELSRGPYALADNVTDADFDAAIGEPCEGTP